MEKRDMKKADAALFGNVFYILKKSWGFNKPFVVLKTIRAIISGLTPACTAYLYKLVVAAITDGDWRLSLQWIGVTGAFTLLSSLASALISKRITLTQDLFRNALLFELQEKIVNMDPELLLTPETAQKRDLANRIVSNNLSSKFLDSVFAIASGVVSLISVGYIVSTVSYWVLLVFALLCVLKVITIVVEKNARYKSTVAMSPVNTKITYYITMFTDPAYSNDVRMYSISDWIIKKYKKAVADLQQIASDLLNRNFNTFMLRTLLSVVESSLFYAFLAAQVIFLGMSFANFTMFLTALQTFSGQITAVISGAADIGENSLYVSAYREFLNIRNKIAVDGGIPVPRGSQSNDAAFVLRDVAFRYPGSKKLALTDLNLTIRRDKFYVVVGENGVGKTTLCKLLCRLYDASGGSIQYNGENIKRYYYRDYRNQIGIVFQDFKHYELSVAENVAMNSYDGREETRARIYECLRMAGLQAKIDSLERGIDTQLGRTFDENGVFLSGGELQKLALARVLFMDTPVVILDEPSSALDPYAEDELITLFTKRLSGKTVFYISHRLSIAKYADAVIFLADNTVRGFGTHNELLESNDAYAKLYNAQAKHYTGHTTVTDMPGIT
jgi:ABC-type multidrug transport system fused ATPase/permease subunit